MRARALTALLAVAAAVALALPGGALAKPGYFKVPGEHSEVIQLKVAGGYSFALQVFNRRADVTFSKNAKGSGFQLLTYSLRRRLAPGPDIRFYLGRHGEVDLHFVPGKRKVRRNTGCTGGPSVTETGHFVGTIRVHGQGGVGDVDLHRVAGVVSSEPPLTCRRVKPQRGVVSIGLKATKGKQRVPKGTLELIAAASDRGVHFEALRTEEPETFEASPFLTFVASIVRREGDVTATSSASAGSVGHGFVSPDPEEPLSAAQVSPGAPFTGSATFEMTSPKHGEWSGDLAVELPGYGRVPLTGPKFSAGLCDAEACTPTLPRGLRPRTGPAKTAADESGFTGNFVGG